MSIANKRQREAIYERVRPRIFTGRDFQEWMARHNLTKRGASKVLGLSPITTSKLIHRDKIPVKIGWACDLIDEDNSYIDVKKPPRYQRGEDLAIWRERLGLTLDAASTLLGIYFRRYWEKEKEKELMSRYLGLSAQYLENKWHILADDFLRAYNECRKEAA